MVVVCVPRSPRHPPADLGLLCLVSAAQVSDGKVALLGCPCRRTYRTRSSQRCLRSYCEVSCPWARAKGLCSVSSPSAPSPQRCSGGWQAPWGERTCGPARALPGASGRPEHPAAVLCPRADCFCRPHGARGPVPPGLSRARRLCPVFLAGSESCLLSPLPPSSTEAAEGVCFSPGGSLLWLWGGA